MRSQEIASRLLRLLLLTATFPLRLSVTLFVTIFDLLISRYLLALPCVALIWLPLHFAAGLNIWYLYWPTIILGTMLAGLWEGCDIFVINRYVPRWLLFAAPMPFGRVGIQQFGG